MNIWDIYYFAYDGRILICHPFQIYFSNIITFIYLTNTTYSLLASACKYRCTTYIINFPSNIKIIYCAHIRSISNN